MEMKQGILSQAGFFYKSVDSWFLNAKLGTVNVPDLRGEQDAKIYDEENILNHINYYTD